MHVSASFFFREYRGGQTLGDGGGTCRRRDRLIQIDRREAKPNEALVANLRDGRPGRGITGEKGRRREQWRRLVGLHGDGGSSGQGRWGTILGAQGRYGEYLPSVEMTGRRLPRSVDGGPKDGYGARWPGLSTA